MRVALITVLREHAADDLVEFCGYMSPPLADWLWFAFQDCCDTIGRPFFLGMADGVRPSRRGFTPRLQMSVRASRLARAPVLENM